MHKLYETRLPIYFFAGSLTETEETSQDLKAKTNSNIHNIKTEDHRPSKKIKIEQPSTSHGVNFNHGSQKKNVPQQSVKRIHKKYT